MGPAPLVLLAALLVGFASLASELLWIRGLGRGVGTPYESAAAIVGLMLLGLGVGAMQGSRRASRHERPARGAALCLLVAGTWIALSPHYLARVGGWHAALAGEEPGMLADLLPVILLAIPLVLPAAFALGRAFPLLVRARVMDLGHAGRRTGSLYACDTLGALLGVGAGLVLLVTFGEAASLRVAGGAALVGALALLLGDRPLPHGDGPPPSRAPDGHAETGRLRLPLAAAGLAALMAQMAWLRLLQPLAGAHELGAALLLAPILASIALGAAISGPLADRLRTPTHWLPAIFLAGGLLTLLSLPLAGCAPLDLVTSDPEDHLAVLAAWFTLTVGPASLVFGMLLPLAVRIRASWTGSTAGPAGRLYGWNALGALLGSTLAGFVLLPVAGAERTLLVAATIALAVGLLLRWRIPGSFRVPGLLLGAVPLVVLAWPGVTAAWLRTAPSTVEIIASRNPTPPRLTLEDREDLAVYARYFAGQPATRLTEEGSEPMPVYEGHLGRIALIEEPSGIVGLRRGALRESIFAPDDPNVPSGTEYALGLLPALLCPDAERALVVGHGAGWTAEAVLAASDAALDVAEVDPQVLDAVRAWRGLEALPVERAARARIVPRDGRLILRRAAADALQGRYDVIVSQPSHPWSRASGHLFSVEAFEAARDALTERGVMAQWLGLEALTPELFERALASFRHAFPSCWVFRFPNEVILLGFRDAPRIDAAHWEAFFAPDNPRAEAARRAGLTGPGMLWRHFTLDAAAVARVVPEHAPLLRDDRPELEFALARRRLTHAAPEAAEQLLFEGFPPDMEAVLPAADVRERWVAAAVEGWLDLGGVDEAGTWTRKVRMGTTPAGMLARAEALRRAGRARAAATMLEGALRRWPTSSEIVVAWVGALTDWAPAAAPTEREPHLERLGTWTRTSFAQDADVLAAAARLRRALGDVEGARALFERAVALDDPPPGTRVHLARLLLSGPHGDEELERAMVLLENDPKTYEDTSALDMLMRLRSMKGDMQRADELERALRTLVRSRGLARLRGAGALLAARRFPEALEAARDARALWPGHASPHEWYGLAALCAIADATARGDTPPTTEAEARAAFGDAIARARRPDAMRARADRILGWFGLAPVGSQDEAAPDAE